MRTFHIGGAATKVSEENRTYLRFPAFIRRVEGNTVKLDNGNLLFTRKGAVFVNKILHRMTLKSSDEILVSDGQKVLAGEILGRRGNREIKAPQIGFVAFAGKEALLVAQEQRVEIRNGAEMFVITGKRDRHGGDHRRLRSLHGTDHQRTQRLRPLQDIVSARP
jgi:DNA-directed RNA polymerase subunit beta'